MEYTGLRLVGEQDGQGRISHVMTAELCDCSDRHISYNIVEAQAAACIWLKHLKIDKSYSKSKISGVYS